MIRIETERLILRPFSDGDLSALFMLLSDEEVTVFLLMFPLKDMEEARLTSGIGISRRGFEMAVCIMRFV